MKPKFSPEKDNSASASIICVDANQTSDASLKDKDQKMNHGGTMLPQPDPPCRKQELAIALAVITKVMSLEVAEPFNVPVNPVILGINDYFDVIDTPMDFGTVHRNLENGVKYMKADDVFNDVKYIWENCYKYSKPGDLILELVEQVKEKFIMIWNAVGLHRLHRSTEPIKPPDPSTGDKHTHQGSSSSPKRKRGRSRTSYIGLQSLKPGERITPQWSERGELIESGKGKRLSGYMGMLVRCKHYVPLQVKDWTQVPDDAKKKLWSLILEKFDIGDEHKKYVMCAIRRKYGNYRCKMKAKYYDPYSTDKERLSNRPSDVSQDDWRWLINYWGTPEVRAVSERNKANRSKQVMRHTSGSKSHAQLRHEQTQMRKDGKEPNEIEMFVLTHTRKDGAPVDNLSRDIMTQFDQELSAQPARRSPPPLETVYTNVMLRNGRLRRSRLGSARYNRRSAEALEKRYAYVKEQLASVTEELEKERKELEEIALQKQRMQVEVKEWMEEQLITMKNEMTQELEKHMLQFQQRINTKKSATS